MPGLEWLSRSGLADGHGTGLDVEFQVTHLCTYREGKLLRDEIYATDADALEAAGLRE
jgi:hypothetical protein